ncbi:MAG: glycosyltransferase family 2 protein [Treponema sp.]|jgi:glycosyltransferase involved in cell wall biosynthesis|nr:glycosyltransferase family 2 protein [Treponema sp.]
MKHGFIIPVYRHGKTACVLAEYLASFRMPVIIVDDGNDEETKNILAAYAASCCDVSRSSEEADQKDSLITLVRLEKNSGKGGAVCAGIKKAREMGITHALQIDADGQHDTGRIEFFLEQSVKYPDKIICGYPEFDDTAPKSRVKGRRISTFWGMAVTLSAELKDLLCGFRIYPVNETFNIIKNNFMDKRMGFDPEILVRLFWKKIYPDYHPIKVNYPKDGVSNFNAVNDNIRISLTFARLFFGMLIRFPVLITRNIKRKNENERE